MSGVEILISAETAGSYGFGVGLGIVGKNRFIRFFFLVCVVNF